MPLYPVGWEGIELGFEFQREMVPDKSQALLQTHGSHIIKFNSENARVFSNQKDSPILPSADGIWTDEKGVSLVIQTADCVPVFFYCKTDAKNRKNLVNDGNESLYQIGAIHAGWRGTARNISGIMVHILHQHMDKATEMFVMIGHCIRKCHYEVKQDVASQFQSFPDALEEREGKLYLDLVRVIICQLLAQGVGRQNIIDLGKCTYCESALPSYRRDGAGCGMLYHFMRISE